MRTCIHKLWNLFVKRTRSHGVRIAKNHQNVKPNNRPKIYKNSHAHALLATCGGNKMLETIKIKKTLLDLGISQTELGKRMGLSLESVNHAVSRRRPSTHVLDEIYALAQKAGVLDE
jgi:hypothetical protein